MLNSGLGWRGKDEEDRGFLQAGCGLLDAIPIRYTAPEEIDPRPIVRTEDQGQMGSCTGHGTSTALEICNWLDTGGQELQLSRMYAYLKAQEVDGLIGRDQGATISGAVKAAMKWGICREETFPYPQPVRYSTEISREAVDEATQHKLIGHEVLNNTKEWWQWLSSGVGPIIIGIPWWQSFAENRDGLIHEVGGQIYGGHCVAIIGYTKRKAEDGRNWFILANSHGRQWGNNGFAEVHPRVVDIITQRRDTESIGVTNIEEFTPSRIDWLIAEPMV